MSTTLQTFVAFALMAPHFAFPEQIIKSFSDDVEKGDKKQFHLAQIIPPGKYKVIIWDKLLNTELLNSAIFDHVQSKPSQRELVFAFDQKNFDDFHKYFAHFYKVDTDEKGQFLLRKNARIGKWSLAKRFFHLAITPMKGASLIPADGTGGMFVWQKNYVRKLSDTVDSVCRFAGKTNQCLVNYFERVYDWKRFIRLALHIFWLADSRFFGALPQWINFFLIASFRHVINEAKRNARLGSELGSSDAEIIGIFWNAFATAHRQEILLERIRMADDRMIGLIDEFCQINRSFLIGHDEIISGMNRENAFESFCPKWAEMRQSLSLLTQNDAVMDSFNEWVHSNGPPPPISAQSQRIVQFWLKMFSVWLTKETSEAGTAPPRLSGPWLALDLSLFRQIGDLFETTANCTMTAQRIKSIGGGLREALRTICARSAKGKARSEFLRCNGQRSVSVLNKWSKFCTRCAAPLAMHMVERGQQDNDDDHSADDGPTPAEEDAAATRCVICLSNERQIAFTPCRHLCVCEHCARAVRREEDGQQKCPVCRGRVEGAIRIYSP